MAKPGRKEKGFKKAMKKRSIMSQRMQKGVPTKPKPLKHQRR